MRPVDPRYVCAGEQSFSMVPAGPPPAIDMSPGPQDICAARSRYGFESPPMKIAPLSSPVSVKKTGLFEASPKMGFAVSVNVRKPDAS